MASRSLVLLVTAEALFIIRHSPDILISQRNISAFQLFPRAGFSFELFFLSPIYNSHVCQGLSPKAYIASHIHLKCEEYSEKQMV